MLIAGRFLLADPVSASDRGPVWRAHDQALNREVAVEEVPLPARLAGEERPVAAAALRRRGEPLGRQPVGAVAVRADDVQRTHG